MVRAVNDAPGAGCPSNRAVCACLLPKKKDKQVSLVLSHGPRLRHAHGPSGCARAVAPELAVTSSA